MITVDRWIDIDIPEAQKIEKYNFTKKIITIGLEDGLIAPNNQGQLWIVRGNRNPVHVEIDGKLVGLLYKAKAPN